MDDKARPGWSVVMKKEARGRRITTTELDLALGQEETHGDRGVFIEMETERRERANDNVGACAMEEEFNGRRRSQRQLEPQTTNMED